MIDPPPASRISGTARRQHKNMDRTLTAIVSSQSATSSSSIGPVGPETPTLLHNTSTPPIATAASSKSCSTSVWSATSAPVNPTPSGSPSPPPGRSATCTVAPAAQKASTMARPIPAAPAVTTTRRPSQDHESMMSDPATAAEPSRGGEAGKAGSPRREGGSRRWVPCPGAVEHRPDRRVTHEGPVGSKQQCTHCRADQNKLGNGRHAPVADQPLGRHD